MPKPFVSSLSMENVLSFGPARQEIELAALNVLIGPNGSGKSNLVEVFGMLRALPGDALDPEGAFSDWIWKGGPDHAVPRFGVSATLHPKMAHSVSYACTAIATSLGRLLFERERVELRTEMGATHGLVVRDSEATSLVFHEEKSSIEGHRLDVHRSILAQVRDPSRYWELGLLVDDLAAITIHREWSFGSRQAARRPQRTDLDNRRLLPQHENLALVLQRLRKDAPTRRALIENVRALSPDFEDFDVAIEAGFIHVLVQERGWSTPAARLSEGTLRWLTLLAILLDPQPPPLVVIEEPELGLHPDLIVRLAEILKETSTRTQVVVTTHSDILIDAIADPAALLVFDKEDGVSRVTRPDGPEVKEWLKKYSLGRLWLDGEIGGKRW